MPLITTGRVNKKEINLSNKFDKNHKKSDPIGNNKSHWVTIDDE